MNEKWKVGDRVRLAGVEGNIEGVVHEGVWIRWIGIREQWFRFDNPLYAKLERVAPEPKLERVAPEPKPLPELELFQAFGIHSYQRRKLDHPAEGYSPRSALKAAETDVARLREYLGEAAPEKREIKWPVDAAIGAAESHFDYANLTRRGIWFQACKWFREQIEGQL